MFYLWMLNKYYTMDCILFVPFVLFSCLGSRWENFTMGWFRNYWQGPGPRPSPWPGPWASVFRRGERFGDQFDANVILCFFVYLYQIMLKHSVSELLGVFQQKLRLFDQFRKEFVYSFKYAFLTTF